MSKTDAPDPVLAGQNITYTLSSLNAGTLPATDVVITDTIPASTRFVSATPSAGGNCVTPAVGGSGPVTCTWLGVTPVSTTNSVTLVVSVCPEIACNVIVTNTASTTSATVDPMPGNNSDTEQTTVQSQSDLTLGVVHAPNPVGAGGVLTFTATVTNNGPSNDPNPVFAQTFPAGWVVQTATPSQGTCNATGTNNITCNLGPLGAANQCTTTLPTVATVDYTVYVDLLAFPNNYPVPATVTSGSCVADPNLGDNTVISSIDVVLVSDLILNKVAVPLGGSVAAGREITYNLQVTMGPSQTAGFTLEDKLPPNVRFKSIRIPNGWFCTYPYVGTVGGKVNCVHPLLNPGTYTLGISVWAPPVCGHNLTITNTAIVGSSTNDPNVTNNVSSVNTMVLGGACFQ
jgi:uncharacterized repeat protein (TIGR01451 family)